MEEEESLKNTKNVKYLESKINSWALSEDVSLLESMKFISNAFLHEGSRVKNELSSVLDDCHASSLRITGANNHLIRLASSQFVENRVYDEEVVKPSSSSNASPSPENPLSKEEELLRNVRQGVHTGVGLLQTHFQRLQIDPKHFDEEEGHFSPPPIYEPLEVSHFSPLPFIIGSGAFNGSITGGVQSDQSDSPDHSETIVSLAPKSLVKNDTLDRPSQSAPLVNANNGESVPASDSSGMNRSDSSISDDPDQHIFNQPIQKGLPPSPRQIQPHTSAIVSEPQKILTTKPIAPPRAIKEESSSSDDDWGFKPPPLPVAQPKTPTSNPTKSLLPSQSSTRTDPIVQTKDSSSIFDDSEDEGDIFSVPKSKGLTKSKIEQKQTNLRTNIEPITVPSRQTPIASSSLFSDEDSDENDIFAVSKPQSSNSRNQVSAQKPGRAIKPAVLKEDDDVFAPPRLNPLSPPPLSPNLEENVAEDVAGINSSGDTPKKPDPFLNELRNKLGSKALKDHQTKVVDHDVNSDNQQNDNVNKLSNRTIVENDSVTPETSPHLQHLVKTRAKIPASSKRRPPSSRKLPSNSECEKKPELMEEDGTAGIIAETENTGFPQPSTLTINSGVSGKVSESVSPSTSPSATVTVPQLVEQKVKPIIQPYNSSSKSILEHSAPKKAVSNVVKSNLFDSDSDEDIFSSSKPIQPPPAPPVVRKEMQKTTPVESKPAPTKTSLFDDSSDEDLFK